MNSSTRPPPTARYRGRFAPSPTGLLHLGSLAAALGSWLLARQAGGDWLLRIEDVDRPREVPGAAAAQLRTLQAFGLEPDEPVVYQSRRGDLYADALERLRRAGEAFACRCSRTDLEPVGGVHRRCMPAPSGRRPAWRLRVDDEPVEFVDRFRGQYRQCLGTAVGDFVLRRRDGLWAYQLAVVVDDAMQGISEVVRGADLLDSTPRQIYLQRRLALPTPAYAHLPLLRDAGGAKLGKSLSSLPLDDADPLPALQLAYALLGQDTRPLPGRDAGVAAWLHAALAGFDPLRIPSTDVGLADAGPPPPIRDGHRN